MRNQLSERHNDSDLTVIVVSYNTKEMTLACLGSIFANKRDLRVIVVDNASEDGSIEAICDEFPDLEFIANTKNVGFASANNQALRMTESRYVLLLNSDTLILSDVLDRSIKYMDEHAEVGAFGCRVLNPDGGPQFTCGRYPGLSQLVQLVMGFTNKRIPAVLDRYRLRSWQRDTERDVDTVTGCYLFARMGAVHDIGLLDESFFFYGEETDWCLRFRLAGWKLRFAPIGEIIHFGSASARQLDAERDVLLTAGLVRLHRKHGGILSAFAAWLLLAFFNLSRVAYWTTKRLVDPSKAVASRRDHFIHVSSRLFASWSMATRGNSRV